MIEFIADFFKNINAGKITWILFAAVVLFLSFAYAKKNNMVWLAYVEAIVITVVFVIALFNQDLLPYALYIVITCMIVANLTLFRAEIRHELFKLSWKKQTIADGSGLDVVTEDLHAAVSAIMKTCQDLSKNDVGALMVITDSMQASILDSGTRINATVSAEMLEALFYPKAPLHDGAVIISANKIVAAGCYLPLTQKLSLPKELGTRHRAAIGITETDPTLTAIVVSEETGIISAMHDGKVKRYLDAEALKVVLNYAFGLTEQEEERIIWGE